MDGSRTKCGPRVIAAYALLGVVTTFAFAGGIRLHGMGWNWFIGATVVGLVLGGMTLLWDVHFRVTPCVICNQPARIGVDGPVPICGECDR